MKWKFLLVSIFLCNFTNGHTQYHSDGYINPGHSNYHVRNVPFEDEERDLNERFPSEDYLDTFHAKLFGPWDSQPPPPYNSRENSNVSENARQDMIRPEHSSKNIFPPAPRYRNPWFSSTRDPQPTKKPHTINQAFTDCIRGCPVTSEYSPVCGSNNITYTNPGRLECAKNCGVQVELSRKTSCSIPIMPTQPPQIVNPYDKSTTETTNWQSSTNTQPPYISNDSGNKGNKENNGNGGSHVINGNTGSNGNMENIWNGGTNGNGVMGENNNWNDTRGNEGVNESNNGNGINNGANGCNGGNMKPPSVEEVMACTQLCPLSSEYNPVCGTDGITYSNPGRLLCSQFCGIDVKVKKFAACSSNVPSNIYNNCPCSPFTNPTDKPLVVTVPTNSATTCIENCPVSADVRPVCGTNGMTYMNLDSLTCVRQCGIDVAVQYPGACAANAGTNVTPNVVTLNSPTSKPFTVEQCLRKCSVGIKYLPLCGTDNITYNNTDHLICARQCGVDVEIKSMSACTNNPPTPGNKETVTPNPNGLDFTIPLDILNNIFSHNTTSESSDEDFDIDKRFKETNNQSSASPVHWL